MNIEKALRIVRALNEAEDTLQGHSEKTEDSVIVEYTTDQKFKNFFISVFSELIEIGLPINLRHSGFDSWPYEAYALLEGVEIRCMCTYSDLVEYGLEALPIEASVE